MAENDKGKKAPAKDGKAAAAGRKGKSEAKVAAAPAAPRPKDYKPRMKSLYESKIRAAMKEKFGYDNPMQIPKLEKIVLNMGVGEAVADKKKVESASGDLALISGQKPVQTKARKSIAVYKLNPKSFDGRGNYACGIKEHIVFPEIDYDKVDQVWGLDVIICTSATTDDEARELLKNFNFPFRT